MESVGKRERSDTMDGKGEFHGSKRPKDWQNDPRLFKYQTSFKNSPPDPNDPLRFIIFEKYQDMGTFVVGRVESGTIREGDNLLLMPNSVNVQVISIHDAENRVEHAGRLKSVYVKLAGIEEEDISSGFILSSVVRPMRVVHEFVGQLQIYNSLDAGVLIAGCKGRLCLHAHEVECELVEVLGVVDTGVQPFRHPYLGICGPVVACHFQVKSLICAEEDSGQLGMFDFSAKGQGGIGHVVALPPPGSLTFPRRHYSRRI